MKNQMKGLEEGGVLNADGLLKENQSMVLSQHKQPLNSEETTEANRCIDEAKRAIQLRTKQLEKCKQELKEQTILLQEFEANYNLSKYLSLNISMNGSSLKSTSTELQNNASNEKELNPESLANKINSNFKQLLPPNNSIPMQHQSIKTTNNLSNLNLCNVQQAMPVHVRSQQQAQFTAIQTLQKFNDAGIGSMSIKQVQSCSTDSACSFGSLDTNAPHIQKPGRGRKRKKVCIVFTHIYFDVYF